MSNPLTTFRVGDLDYTLVAKILRSLGGVPRPSDTEWNLWAKILLQLGGSPRPSDLLFDLILKVERILDPANSCNTCGDTEFTLLRKILNFLQPGAFRFGDTRYDLLRKILLFIGNISPVPPVEEDCLLLEDGEELELEDGSGCLLLESA